jgi:hypothetical protein
VYNLFIFSSRHSSIVTRLLAEQAEFDSISKKDFSLRQCNLTLGPTVLYETGTGGDLHGVKGGMRLYFHFPYVFKVYA